MTGEEQGIVAVDSLVIGGGPAGLMAAETLARAGHQVLLTEAMPTVGRKLLMAGRSGLNLTKAESADDFLAAYGAAADWLAPSVAAFGPATVRAWAVGLGQQTFVGSTGRVFPVAMKASPLLRAWIARLEALGVVIQTRWRWTGWQGDVACFETADGPCGIRASATVLALGGASWKRLGSDGAWAPVLADEGVLLAPFEPANVGLRIRWSDRMTPHFGVPIKGIALRAGRQHSRGEITISARGLEGGGLYSLTPELRKGHALHIDFAPDRDESGVRARLRKLSRKVSLSNQLRRVLGIDDAARALLTEFARPLPMDPDALVPKLKNCIVAHDGLRPMDEAISTAGGVRLDGLGTGFMLATRPGVFCAGEMLDWEAPTGGYLITGCLATGQSAGLAAAAWVGKPAFETRFDGSSVGSFASTG